LAPGGVLESDAFDDSSVGGSGEEEDEGEAHGVSFERIDVAIRIPCRLTAARR
jgi:hypothetical protein